jgi:hypothetical protein
MKEPIFKDNMLEAVFRQAVIDNFEREIDELSREGDARTDNFAERHEKRMAALFARENKKDSFRRTFRTARRFAAVAAVLLFIVNAALLFTPDVREAVGNAFIQWFGEYTKFDATDSENADNDNWVPLPQSIPVGFVLTNESQSATIKTFVYSNSDGRAIALTRVPADNSISVNNENVEYGQTIYGETVYHTFAAINEDYNSSVVWDGDGYRYCVRGTMPLAVLLEVAYTN